MNTYRMLCHKLAALCLGFCACCLVSISAVIAYQVFARYLLNNSPVWSEPLAMLLLLYMVLIGAALGIREQFHLGLLWFRNQLSPTGRHNIQKLEALVVIAVALAMIYYGSLMMNQTQYYPIAGLPLMMSTQYLALVASGILICLFAFEQLLPKKEH